MTTYFTVKNINGQTIQNAILRSDNAWIPCDPLNTDYQAYLAWVAEGNTAEEWQPDGN